MASLQLGIDIGTTGTKTVLFDAQRGVVAQSTSSTALVSPHERHAEADPRQWWENACSGIRAVLADAGARASDISAVSTTGMVPAVVLVDGENRPLRAAILQNDARAASEVGSLREALDCDSFLRRSGSAISQQSVPPKLMWLRRHEPERFRLARTVLGSYDWLLTALGADPHTEQNWAIESGLYGLNGDVLDDVLEASGLDRSLLAPVVPPGRIVGAVSRSAARATGLAEGTALVVGGADHVLSSYMAGVAETGDWLVKLGGAGDILVAADTAVVDARLYLDAHVVPDRWLPNGCMATSGSLLRWLQGITGSEQLHTMDREAARCPPSSVLCLPYFLGEKSPLHDPDLRGAFAGLTLATTRAELYRAALEAIAFGFRRHKLLFESLGHSLSTARVTNGGSSSRLWKQIHADVLGVELFPVIDHPGASAGAAAIAGVAMKAFSDWQEPMEHVRLDAPLSPDPVQADIYDDAYERWEQLSSALTDVSHAMASSPDAPRRQHTPQGQEREGAANV